MPRQPILFPFHGGFPVPFRYLPGFVPDAVNSDYALLFHEKIENSCVELSHMSQLKQIVPYRFGQRRPVILSILQFFQTCQEGSKIARVRFLKILEKVADHVGPQATGCIPGEDQTAHRVYWRFDGQDHRNC